MATTGQAMQRFGRMEGLYQKFCGEYLDIIEQYEPSLQVELTEHLMRMMEYLQLFSQQKDNAVYQEMAAAETALLKKYGSLLLPYSRKKFHGYFFYQTVLMEKGIVTNENGPVAADDICLSGDEISMLADNCYRFLDGALVQLLLLVNPCENDTANTAIAGSETAAEPELTEPEDGSEYTQARQLLALHYLLAAEHETELRTNATVAAVTRFAHFITGKPFSKLRNSGIYKRCLRMPNFKTGEPLIEDLLYIRQYFMELNIVRAVQLIDADIERERREMKGR